MCTLYHVSFAEALISWRVRCLHETLGLDHRIGLFRPLSISKYSVNPLLPSEKAELSRKSCYTVAYGTHRTTREVDLRTCTSEREWHHALFPTDGGTDKAGLYPAQMGGALLAEATRATSGARNRS